MASVSSPILLDRVADLGRLEAAWRDASGARPRLVLLAGEAGIGKSRLLRELAGRGRADGGLAFIGSCLRFGDAPIPFVPIAEIVRRLTRDPDERARRALEPARGELAALVPTLLETDGSAATDELPRHDLGEVSESAARSRLFETVLALVGRLATDRPLLLGVEDVQWSDPATRDLLTFLVRNLTDERLLLVLTLRTDGLALADTVVGWLAELLRALAAERIDLDRLPLDEVERQIEAITGRTPSARALDAIWRRSEGNPFFVEELLAAGAAAVDDGEGGGRVPLPRTLAEILQARVAALSDDSRGVVRAVAVAGGPVGDRVLAEALGIGSASLRSMTAEPIEAGLLRVDEAGRLRPRHALLGEVLVAAMLTEERRELHEALAIAMDHAPPAAGDEAAVLAAARAGHWLAAGRLPEAYAASLDAADAASAVFAYAEAASQLAQALELARRLPTPPSSADRVGILGRAVDALDLAGDEPAAIERVGEAIELVDERRDPHAAGVLHGKLGYLLWVTGHPDDALAEHRRAVALVPSDPPTPERARVLAALGGALMGAGHYAESIAHCEQAVEVAIQVGAVAEESRARIMLGSDQVALGDIEAGLAQLREARRIAGQGSPLDLLVVAHHNLALNLLLADQRDEAVEEAMAGLELSRRVGLGRRFGPHLAGVAADALFRSGRWDEAVAAADEQLATGPPSRATLHLVGVRARLHAGQGQLEAAEARLADAAAQGSEELDPDLLAYLTLARAEAALGGDRPEEATSVARDGLRAIAETEDDASRLPLLAVATRGLAELAEDARAGGRQADAETAAAESGALAADAERIAGGSVPPGAVAWATRAAAEAARAAGEPSAERWRAAVEAADAAGMAYLAAEARLGLADAILRARGERSVAEPALRTAADAATRLGARPLAAAIETLARRARIDIAGEATPVAAPTAAPPARAPGPALSERELEVLRLVALGRTNGQIAEALFITRKTASTHVTHILDKLGVSSRLEAAMVASRRGLLQPGDAGDAEGAPF